MESSLAEPVAAGAVGVRLGNEDAGGKANVFRTGEQRHRQSPVGAGAPFKSDRNLADPTRIPVLPSPVARVLSAIPLAAIDWPLERVIRTVARRHSSLFVRLGEYASMTFLIDPTDLPFAFRLWPRPDEPRIEVVRRPLPSSWDARVAGPLAALLGMVHGALDGDALFFSRDLTIEGNTEAILALRNAIDDAEIDLLAEAAAALGPLASILDRPVRVILPIAERLTGVALSRAGERPA